MGDVKGRRKCFERTQRYTSCPSTLPTLFTITMSVTGFTRIPRKVFEQIQSYS